MSKGRDIKRNFIRLMMFGLSFGVFAFQANAQNSSDLSGTYQIDTQKSENVGDIIDAATRNNRVSADQKEDLEDKLNAPATISIDIRGKQVTLSSSSSSPVTFTADGRMQNVRRANGSNIRVRTSLRRNTLKISTLGGSNDYTITLASIDNGKGLQVTRMVTTDYLRQTIFADSNYNKTASYSSNNSGNSNTTYSDNKDDDGYSSSNPKDDGYSNSDSKDDGYSNSDSKDDGYSSSDPDDRGASNYPNDDRNGKSPKTTTRTGDFYVPNGTVLTGTLENLITTKASQNNDRFSLTVESPSEYSGAIIEGYLTGLQRRGKGKVSGSSKLTLNFETIRLRNGRSYDFAGVLQSVKDSNGKTVKVNEEGQIKGKSRTKESVKRGGIGAGLGAIIGGIIGGGKGAIIGATIGGAGGAGTVAVDGKGDLELEQGTQISVQSTSPNRR